MFLLLFSESVHLIKQKLVKKCVANKCYTVNSYFCCNVTKNSNRNHCLKNIQNDSYSSGGCFRSKWRSDSWFVYVLVGMKIQVS